jgi:hypothetical protein
MPRAWTIGNNMEKSWSMQPKNFTGHLSKEGDKVSVSFTIGVCTEGDVVITFVRFPLDQTSTFIGKHFHVSGTHFSEFHLSGSSSDGTFFECDNIIFTSLGERVDAGIRTIAPKAHYSVAKLTLSEDVVSPPTLTWRLKGFESFHSLTASCPLGTVEMWGAKNAVEKGEMSGVIRIRALGVVEDLDDWIERVFSLCDDLRHIMSFAAGVNLTCPIMELSNNGQISIEANSQGRQEKSESAIFSPLHLDAIFQCAIKFHFQPAFEVRNLHFAIQWFVMRPFYREAHLISLMTVLENLIDSNLPDEDTLLLSPQRFEKLRKGLSKVIKTEVLEWTTDPAEQKAFVQDLNNRLTDLKRRSLVDKLVLLGKRWGVKFEDIAMSEIREAKTARDHVVHRGQYEPKPGASADLYDHILTVREMVVRFILTALQFEGRYMSYRGGYHSRVFEKNLPKLQHELGGVLVVPGVVDGDTMIDPDEWLELLEGLSGSDIDEFMSLIRERQQHNNQASEQLLNKK